MLSRKCAGRLIVCALMLCSNVALGQSSYQLFESGPVRPMALSPNGERLFVVNTPDGYLEIFEVGYQENLTRVGSVAVGLEPVAVAARTDDEVWVVNHLSDSVSIVDVSGVPRVVRTLLVGDEPNDIVFAGADGDQATGIPGERSRQREGRCDRESDQIDPAVPVQVAELPE